MKPYHLLAGLYGLALVLIGSIVAHDAPPLPHPAAAMLLGLALGQIACVAAWLVWGHRSFPLRFAATAVSLVLLASQCLHVASRPGFGQWLCVLSGYAALILIPLGAMRVGGLRPAAQGWAPCQSPGRRGRAAWQFSLAGLLTVTTVVSVLLALGRRMQLPWHHGVEVASYCIGFSVVAVASLWSAFGQRAAVLRPLASCSAIGLVAAAFGSAYGNTAQFLIVTGTQAAVIWAAALVVRVGGYGPPARRVQAVAAAAPRASAGRSDRAWSHFRAVQRTGDHALACRSVSDAE